jgi:hypothetical protein
VQFTGNWDDGAFNHAFGTHRYPVAFELDNLQVVLATDPTGQQLPLDPAIRAAGESLFNDYQDSILDRQNDNPPSSGPDPDDQRERDIDRQMGL